MIRNNVKNYLRIFALIAFIIAMSGGVSVVKAAYNNITFAAETTLVVGGETLYVLSGGTAVSYTINSTSVSFEMTTSSSITVRSLGKKVMNTNLDAYSCASTFSTVSRTSTATETLTITPTNTTCSIPSGGGGGVVTNSATPIVETPAVASTSTLLSTPVSTPELTVTPVVTASQVSAPSIQITAGAPFTKRLAAGSQNSDVRKLQEMLLNDGVYPDGLITGYFGAFTKKAVQRFQEKYGIAKQGDPGYGDVGPNTRVKLNKVLEGTSAMSASSTQLEAQIKTLQEQLVLLLAELAKQLQAQAIGQ